MRESQGETTTKEDVFFSFFFWWLIDQIKWVAPTQCRLYLHIFLLYSWDLEVCRCGWVWSTDWRNTSEHPSESSGPCRRFFLLLLLYSDKRYSKLKNIGHFFVYIDIQKTLKNESQVVVSTKLLFFFSSRPSSNINSKQKWNVFDNFFWGIDKKQFQILTKKKRLKSHHLYLF